MSASAVVIHYEEALYQVYAPLPLHCDMSRKKGTINVFETKTQSV